MREIRSGSVCLLALSLLTADCAVARAHRLLVSCTLHTDQKAIQVEAYFDDDTAARGAQVQVLAVNGQELAQGRTDKDGRWTFAAPRPGEYEVVVDAGAGHRKQTGITVPPSTALAEKSDHGSSPAARAENDLVQISDGPSRRDSVSFPLLNLLLGLGMIGLLSLILWWLLQRRRAAPPRSPPALPRVPEGDE
jgi:hypothetical protein